LIRAQHERGRDGEAERLGGLEVDDQLECGRLLATVLVSSREPTAGLTAVVEPSIQEFLVGRPVPVYAGPFWAEITYRFTLYGADGQVITSWTVTGTGEQRGVNSSGARGAAADRAMQDASTRFLDRLQDFPGVRRWLRESVGASTPSPRPTP
jgi:hypothetical protein